MFNTVCRQLPACKVFHNFGTFENPLLYSIMNGPLDIFNIGDLVVEGYCSDYDIDSYNKYNVVCEVEELGHGIVKILGLLDGCYSDGYFIHVFANGVPHRENGPAIFSNCGSLYEMYYLRGMRHRSDGPAYIGIDSVEYYINDRLHRTDGPAKSSSTASFYFFAGKLHNDPCEAAAIYYESGLQQCWHHGNYMGYILT